MKLRKAVLCLALCAITALTFLPTMASAATVASGSCGENLTWKLDDAGTLTISGTGAMTDFIFSGDVPWEDHWDKIAQFVFPAGITFIDPEVFSWSDIDGYWVDAANQHYSSDSCGVLFNKDKTTLIAAPGNLYGSYALPETVETIEELAFSDSNLSEILLPDSLEVIGERAFANCHNLDEIVVPYRVYSIGTSAFSTGGLGGFIRVDEDNLNFSNDSNGVLFNKDKTILLQAPSGLTGSYTVPGTVKIIDAYSFSGLLHMTEVIIPESVTRIEEYAFFFCYRLAVIRGCKGLRTVGEAAISSCDALTDVYYDGTMNQAMGIQFGPRNDSLANATFHFRSTVPGDMDGDGDKDTDDAVYLLLNVMFGDEDYPLAQ